MERGSGRGGERPSGGTETQFSELKRSVMVGWMALMGGGGVF
jgi:hypothetical protein